MSLNKILVIVLALLVNGFTQQSTLQSQNFKGIGVVLSTSKNGVIIRDIYPNGPSEVAGVEKNDVIIKVNGEVVNSANVARTKIISSDGYVLLLVKRGEEELDFEVDKVLFAVGNADDFEISNGVYVVGSRLISYDVFQEKYNHINEMNSSHTFWQKVIGVELEDKDDGEFTVDEVNKPSKCFENKICIDAEVPSQAFVYIGDLVGRTRGIFTYDVKVGQNIIAPPSDFQVNSDEDEYVFVRLPYGTFMLK